MFRDATLAFIWRSLFVQMLVPYLAVVLLVLATAYSAMASFREPREGATPTWLFPASPKRPGRVFAGIASIIVLIGFAMWVNLSGQKAAHRSVALLLAGDPSHQTVRFLIPEGYSGWVRVDFDVPGSPGLVQTEGNMLIQIPPSGTLKTSSPAKLGGLRMYDFYSMHGTRSIPQSGDGRFIWGKINGVASGASGKREYEEFFVGTEQQFKEQAGQLKSDGAQK